MAVHVTNLTKTFTSDRDVVAVSEVSFEAPDARITALLGPSGSGKSTLLRLIAGLEHADRGSIAIDGQDVVDVPPAKRNIGFVFQNYALFGQMTVEQNIAFGLKVRGEPVDASAARVAELLALVQMEGYERRYPAELSGGQRQRVALARALAPRPRVLLLDEPFGALDTRVRAELREWLAELHHETRVTTLLVTHDQHEALEVAEQIVLLSGGTVAQAGTPDDLYLAPDNAFVASFLGDAQVLRAPVEDGKANFAGVFSVPSDAPNHSVAELYLRPEDIALTDHGPTARVGRITRIGPHTRVSITTQDGTSLRVQLSRHDAIGQTLTEGSVVHVRLRRSTTWAVGR